MSSLKAKRLRVILAKDMSSWYLGKIIKHSPICPIFLPQDILSENHNLTFRRILYTICYFKLSFVLPSQATEWIPANIWVRNSNNLNWPCPPQSWEYNWIDKGPEIRGDSLICNFERKSGNSFQRLLVFKSERGMWEGMQTCHLD